jgi:hypothetical protein
LTSLTDLISGLPFRLASILFVVACRVSTLASNSSIDPSGGPWEDRGLVSNDSTVDRATRTLKTRIPAKVAQPLAACLEKRTYIMTILSYITYHLDEEPVESGLWPRHTSTDEPQMA